MSTGRLGVAGWSCAAGLGSRSYAFQYSCDQLSAMMILQALCIALTLTAEVGVNTHACSVERVSFRQMLPVETPGLAQEYAAYAR